MPTMSKQALEKTPTPVKSGLLSRVVNVNSLRPSPIKVLFYGGNRTGKTTLACEFEKPLLLVSFEPTLSGGAASVRKVKGVSYLRVVPNNSLLLTEANKPEWLFTIAEVLSLTKELRAQLSFKTIVLDSVTSLQDVVLSNLLDLPAIPEQLGWGSVSSEQYRIRSEQTRETIRPFLDIPVDTVFLAKEKDHNPPKEERVSASGKVQPDMRPDFIRGLQEGSFVAAEIGGATVGWLQDACDSICRLYVEKEIKREEIVVNKQKRVMERETGRYTRYLRTGYHPNYAAGIRSPDPDSVPDTITASTPRGLYVELMKLLRPE